MPNIDRKQLEALGSSGKKTGSSLTWNEFKEVVDRALKVNKLSKNTKIMFIDIDYPDEDNIGVRIIKGGGLTIFNRDV